MLPELKESVVQSFDEGSLRRKLVDRGLFSRLDFDAGRGVFETEEESACIFEVLDVVYSARVVCVQWIENDSRPQLWPFRSSNVEAGIWGLKRGF